MESANIVLVKVLPWSTGMNYMHEQIDDFDVYIVIT